MARVGAIALCVVGCNSRRFVSQGPSGVGNAWDGSQELAQDSGPSSPESTSEWSCESPCASHQAADSSSPVPVSASAGNASETGAGSNASGETAVAPSGASASDGAPTTNGDGTNDGSSAATDGATDGASQTAPSTSAFESGSPTSDEFSSDPGYVPASLTERAASISALPNCDPGQIVSVLDAAVLDFDTETSMDLASGLLTLTADEQTLGAVLAWYQDDTGDYQLAFTSGADGSVHGVSASNPEASGWGGGVALVVQCLDASRFEGVEFWLKGETPVGKAVFGVDARAELSGSIELPIGSTWTRHRVAFADLEADAGGPANTHLDGSAVRALVWSSQLRYVEEPPLSGNWVAAPGAFEIAVDQVRFY